MRICSIRSNQKTEGGLLINGRLITFAMLRKETGIELPDRLIEVVISENERVKLLKAHNAISRISRPKGNSPDQFRLTAPYNEPPKIWGIGLNYREHAADLGADLPDEPVSFMKPRTAIVGHGDPIRLPPQSTRVTAEAELGIIIGERCKNVGEGEAESVVFGYVPVLDMTAEDILQRNPRFLTRAKSFDTFFSFGPFVLTPDEITNIESATVSTVLNGQVVKANRVHNMIFSLRKLISFHSQMMTLEPGDILSTGTPGAAVINDGDIAECRIDGFPVLSNPVTRPE